MQNNEARKGQERPGSSVEQHLFPGRGTEREVRYDCKIFKITNAMQPIVGNIQ